MKTKKAKPIARSLKSNGQGQGMNWLRPEKRLAIYLRDGLACVYCNQSVEEDGVKLTLDHLRPYSQGGSNAETNLVTCCALCNASRGTRRWKVFAAAVAVYRNHDMTPEKVIRFIDLTRNRVLDVEAAKELIARRGSFTDAVYTQEG